MLSNFFNWLRALFAPKPLGNPGNLTVTRKIKVNSVQAADPSLSIVLVSDDGGIFPPFLQATADIVSNTGGRYRAVGFAASTSPATTIKAQFTDSNFPNESSLTYSISIYTSQTGTGTDWVPFSGTVENASGTTPT